MQSLIHRTCIKHNYHELPPFPILGYMDSALITLDGQMLIFRNLADNVMREIERLDSAKGVTWKEGVPFDKNGKIITGFSESNGA